MIALINNKKIVGKWSKKRRSIILNLQEEERSFFKHWFDEVHKSVYSSNYKIDIQYEDFDEHGHLVGCFPTSIKLGYPEPSKKDSVKISYDLRRRSAEQEGVK